MSIDKDKSDKSDKWWWSNYDYDYKSHAVGGGSRSWMDKMGYSDEWWTAPKKDAKEVYQGLLNQLQNSANIIGGDSVGKIVVHWSDGKQANTPISDKPGTRHIYLSPDNLVSDNSVSEQILDAMTGKVYLASTLRETVDPATYTRAQEARQYAAFKKEGKSADQLHGRTNCICGSRKSISSCCRPKFKSSPVNVLNSAIDLWEAIETSVARSKIMEDWAGFGSYIASDAKRSSASKAAVQSFIDASVEKPSIEAAMLAISWNLLNSADPVSVPDCYDKCIQIASQMMENEIPSNERFDFCQNLASKIHGILKSDEPEEPPESGGEGEAGEGEGEMPMAGAGAAKPGEDGCPSVCDSSLLGENVSNETDHSLSEQTAEGDAAGEDSATISAPMVDGLGTSGKEFVFRRMDGGNRDEYNGVVSKHRSEIYAIRSSLAFRNNINKMVSYGHRSGDIDENSLFKIGMRDDRIMTKRDAVDTKKIAVCLLIDESGSMHSGRLYIEARNVGITIAEGLRGIDGIAVSIYGHTGDDEERSKSTIREYYSPRQRDLSACMGIRARSENYDSWSILNTANIFNKDYLDYDRKIMFVISDGQPSGCCYGGRSAMNHMLEVSKSCGKRGLEVYGIGIKNAYSNDSGKLMYGENRFVVLNDVCSSIGIMSRFIRQVAIKS